MLWLVLGDTSEQIIACNIHTKDNGLYEVWIERPNGKTRRIHASKKKDDVAEIKEAIDFAITEGHKTLSLI